MPRERRREPWWKYHAAKESFKETPEPIDKHLPRGNGGENERAARGREMQRKTYRVAKGSERYLLQQQVAVTPKGEAGAGAGVCKRL